MENFNQNKTMNTIEPSNSNSKSFSARVQAKSGTSSRTGKPYEFLEVILSTEYGDVPLTVWNSDRAYLVLKMLTTQSH